MKKRKVKVYKSDIKTLSDLDNEVFYRIQDIQSILQSMRLPHSIYTIRDYETWKCLNYKCGARHDSEVSVCSACSGPVRPPIIISPRTRGGGKRAGHRRYTADEVRAIVKIFQERV